MLTANILLRSFIQHTKYNKDVNIFESEFFKYLFVLRNLVCKTNIIKKSLNDLKHQMLYQKSRFLQSYGFDYDDTVKAWKTRSGPQGKYSQIVTSICGFIIENGDTSSSALMCFSVSALENH